VTASVQASAARSRSRSPAPAGSMKRIDRWIGFWEDVEVR
jgi:hypothetical protein